MMDTTGTANPTMMMGGAAMMGTGGMMMGNPAGGMMMGNPAGGMMMPGFGFPMMQQGAAAAAAPPQAQTAFGPGAFTEPYDFCKPQAAPAAASMMGAQPGAAMMFTPQGMMGAGYGMAPNMMMMGQTPFGAAGAAGMGMTQTPFGNTGEGQMPNFGATTGGAKVKVTQKKTRALPYERKVN